MSVPLCLLHHKTCLLHKHKKLSSSGSKMQELNFNHPIKCLVAADGSALSIAADANKMKLQINGTDVADFKYVDPHYTAVTSYYHTAGSKPIDLFQLQLLLFQCLFRLHS